MWAGVLDFHSPWGREPVSEESVTTIIEHRFAFRTFSLFLVVSLSTQISLFSFKKNSQYSGEALLLAIYRAV